MRLRTGRATFFLGGMFNYAYCSVHCVYDYIDYGLEEFALKESLPVTSKAAPGIRVNPNANPALDIRILCNQRQAIVRHLVREFPVVIAFCAIVKAPRISKGLDPGPKTIHFVWSVLALRQV